MKFKDYLLNYASTGKKLQGLMVGQQSANEASNQQKIYIQSYSPGYGEFENLCFVSVA